VCKLAAPHLPSGVERVEHPTYLMEGGKWLIFGNQNANRLGAKMKNIGFGFLCLLVFVGMYGALRELSIDVQQSMVLSAATSAAVALISIYTLKIISQPRPFRNEYLKTLFNGFFHTINMIFLFGVFKDSALIFISGNRYAEGNFGDRTYLDWIFVNLSGVLFSLVVFHIIYRLLLSVKSES